jgi:hypothetical protein
MLRSMAPVRMLSLMKSVLLLGAVTYAGCGSHQSDPLYAPSPQREVRISTAEEEVDGFWSSTYGEPRPRLDRVVSLGTIDLPVTSTATPPELVRPGPEGVAPSTSAEANATAITVVNVLPATNSWQKRPLADKRQPASRPLRKVPSGPTPRVTPALTKDQKSSPATRTSLVAPTTPFNE